MGVPLESLTFLSEVISKGDSSKNAVNVVRLQSTSEVKVSVNCEVTMSDYPQYDGADAIYDGLMSALTTAVSDGTFNTELHNAAKEYAASDMLNVTATSTNSTKPLVLSPTYSPTKSHSSSGSKSLSNGAVVAIVAVIAFLFGAITFFIFQFYICKAPTLIEGRPINPDIPMQDISNIAVVGNPAGNPMSKVIID
jgi:hypothetical protein